MKNNIKKRCIDVVLSALLLIAMVPLMVIVAASIWITLGFPILFRQTRPGLNGNPFVLYKFRTMRNVRDECGRQLSDDIRITRIGKLLRRFSLDELPELFNVLIGDMSLVGPRPLLMEYLDHYSDIERRRHEVRPGITGWAQINGRNALSWKNKFEYDLWYIDNCSLMLDIEIMYNTVYQVLLCRGINAEGHVTMPKYTGDDTNNE